jgi:hypothetical protein
MKIFERFNPGGRACPICGTNDDKPCVLIPIADKHDGSIYEAAAVHVECLDLVLYEEPVQPHYDIISQSFKTKWEREWK